METDQEPVWNVFLALVARQFSLYPGVFHPAAGILFMVAQTGRPWLEACPLH